MFDEANPRHTTHERTKNRRHTGSFPANTRLGQKYAASGKHSFTSPAGYLSDAKQITTRKKGNLRGWGDEWDRGRTPEVKHSLSTANWLSATNSRVFYVLFIPLAAEHKRASVICATLINKSTSSAKSKARGHSRHHRRFLNRRGCLGAVPAAARCRNSKRRGGWKRRVTVGDAGPSEGLKLREVAIRETTSCFLYLRWLYSSATTQPPRRQNFCFLCFTSSNEVKS